MLRLARRLPLLLGLALLAVLAQAQQSGYFQSYPGGTTHAVYQISDAKLSNPIKLGFDVKPAAGDQLTVITTNEVTASRDELSGGVFEGMAAAQLAVSNPAVQALAGQQLQVGTTYVLPGGARFSAQESKKIAGAPVIAGFLTDPQKPGQRTRLALAQGEAALTLPFPPLIETETLTDGSYRTTFKLELVEFSRQ
ncbi:MAG TPA: hypothetical protein ENI60_03905 [Candidatus Fraserbacteria bacterium]|nr:hypothetical protein [Candidatus Fraserbacteria bacterium]